MPATSVSTRGPKAKTTTTTKVMGVTQPMDALEEHSRETDSQCTPQFFEIEQGQLHPVVEQASSFTETSFTAHDGNVAKFSSDNSVTTNKSVVSSSSSTSLPYEELQRRYLQINTQRREEYSIRVINALLDALPRGVKTASEGGRLPLHMACFGKATVKVMETILTAYPDAARQRNADGFLPIHIAAHWGVSHPDIAPLLLRAYPDGAVGRNRWERTPIEEALGMAGENGREHQMNVRSAPWRIVDVGGEVPGVGGPERRRVASSRIGGGGAVDVDEVGSSDDESDSGGFEVLPQPDPSNNDPEYIRALAETADLTLLITKDKNWEAATLRCLRHPKEARELLDVKVKGNYSAKVTPIHYVLENNPTAHLVKALVEANPSALRHRQEPGGQLPLHAACTWKASAEVINVLLNACPAAAEACDFLESLPPHCACYSGSDTKVVKALLRVYPQGVWPRNHQGSSAVDIVRRLSHPNRKEVLVILEGTMSGILASKLGKGDASTEKSEEGVQVDADNGLLWVQNS
eukprot:g9081.t1 g9081   contig34:802269-804087(-)